MTTATYPTVAKMIERIDAAETALAAANRKIVRLEAAISWALGESDSDFRERKQFEGAYWWRRELRERARAQEPRT